MQLHTGKQPVCAGMTDSIGLLYVAMHYDAILRTKAFAECLLIIDIERIDSFEN